jgi:hypothetical protein
VTSRIVSSPDISHEPSAGRSTSSVDQLTLAEFINSGHYDRQVRRSRLAYRQRRDRLVDALRRHAPWVRIIGIAAGLHLLLEQTRIRRGWCACWGRVYDLQTAVVSGFMPRPRRPEPPGVTGTGW